VTYNI